MQVSALKAALKARSVRYAVSASKADLAQQLTWLLTNERAPQPTAASAPAAPRTGTQHFLRVATAAEAAAEKAAAGENRAVEHVALETSGLVDPLAGSSPASSAHASAPGGRCGFTLYAPVRFCSCCLHAILVLTVLLQASSDGLSASDGLPLLAGRLEVACVGVRLCEFGANSVPEVSSRCCCFDGALRRRAQITLALLLLTRSRLHRTGRHAS